MWVYCVTVSVLPDRFQDFIAATLVNQAASRREPGVLGFDVLQSEQTPGRFILMEAYRTEADAAAHKQTAHYLAWRDTVAPWMAAPRVGERLRPLGLEGGDAWTR